MDELPHDDDLREVEAALRSFRQTPTPLELDALHRRVTARAAAPARRRRTLGARARLNLLGAALTAGMLLTTGVSVVLAGGSVTGSQQGWTPVSETGSASCVQYNGQSVSGEESKTYTGTAKNPGSNSEATITFTYDCKDREACIVTDKDISNYQWNGDARVNVNGSLHQVCTTVPAGATSVTVTVKAGTTAVTFTFQVPAA